MELTETPGDPGTSAVGTAPRPRPRRRVLVLLAAVVALVLIAAACGTTTEDRNTLHALINQSRSSAGRAPVAQDAALNTEANRWAIEMRNSCTLKHRPDLTVGLPSGWQVVGETVAYNSTLAGAHQSFMNSSGHRAIVQDSRMTHVGIGAVYGECWGWTQVWVVYIFIKKA